MPRRCAALYCGKKYIPNQDNVSYFKFPQEKHEFFAWADLCLRPDLKCSFKEKNRSLFLCRKHFRECDIYQCGPRNYLKKGTLPTSESEAPSTLVESQSASKIHPFVMGEDINNENDPQKSEFTEISDNAHLKNLDEELLCLEPMDSSPNMFETAAINITKNDMPTILCSSEEIPHSESPSNGDDTSKTFQVSNQIPNKDSSSKDTPSSCNSESSICSHHISFVEEKARTYKLKKEISQLRESVNMLKEETMLQREEISRLTEKIEILENQKQDVQDINKEEIIMLQREEISRLSEKIKILENMKQEVSDINSNDEEMMVDKNFINFSDDSSREIKVEFIEKVEEEF